MVNYENGKIYKIVCNETGLIYIGSTAQKYLSTRLGEHKKNYKAYLNGNHNYITSFKVLECENYVIILLENYSCNDKYSLQGKERHYIETIECVNKVIPNRIKKEYCLDNQDKISLYNTNYYQMNKNKLKENIKKYRESNKDKLKEKKKDYYEDNKDEIKVKTKIYQEKNKEKIKERRKQYYLFNKDKMKEQIKKHYEENKEKIKEQKKQYNEDNKDKRKEQMKKYYLLNKDKNK